MFRVFNVLNCVLVLPYENHFYTCFWRLFITKCLRYDCIDKL